MIRRLLGGRKMMMMASSIALGLVPRSPNEEEGRLPSKLLMQRAKWFVLEEEEENVVVGGMVGASAAAVGGHLASSASRPWRWIVVANGFYDYCSFTRRRPLWPHMLFLFFFLLLPFYSWLLLLLLPLLPNEIGGCPMSKARMTITLFSSMLLSRRLCHVALWPLRCRRRPNRKGLESCKVDEQRRLWVVDKVLTEVVVAAAAFGLQPRQWWSGFNATKESFSNILDEVARQVE